MYEKYFNVKVTNCYKCPYLALLAGSAVFGQHPYCSVTHGERDAVKAYMENSSGLTTCPKLI